MIYFDSNININWINASIIDSLDYTRKKPVGWYATRLLASNKYSK